MSRTLHSLSYQADRTVHWRYWNKEVNKLSIYNQKILAAKAAEAHNDQAERIGTERIVRRPFLMKNAQSALIITHAKIESFNAVRYSICKCLHSLALTWNGAMLKPQCQLGGILWRAWRLRIWEMDQALELQECMWWTCTEKVNLVISADDSYITSTLVRQGFVLCSQIRPSMAIMINALELYCVAHLHSLHLSIQAFVKTICDVQGFSITLDLYLNILNGVEALAMEALSRTSDDWHLQYACPVCTYKLKDKPCLKFKILYAMDGNDSLKCILHCTVEDEDSHNAAYNSKGTNNMLPLFAPIQITSKGIKTGDENPCTGHWKNMDKQKMQQTWGVYDDSGIFLAICWHGMSLLIADMVQSRELAKYPIAIVSRLMKVFGADLGGGYDISCQFSTTLAKSVIGKDVKQNQYSCLVPVFHGHAHQQCEEV
ncbi:hypothetical protein F5J12DRAFT_786516 [Pisolithus orientalis]|uniref:uncharacterized protein n=1 Tax=Pisolithus orientalis TaxID=936130 RepID=UPI002223F02D|nr:uncharacterized protein F5J12DRAFT_786516 [Pisolithus orientalis]KAI5990290.1 hypothetical protein F5J12DRAFT_786516 [Pisolithus orientalis]